MRGWIRAVGKLIATIMVGFTFLIILLEAEGRTRTGSYRYIEERLLLLIVSWFIGRGAFSVLDNIASHGEQNVPEYDARPLLTTGFTFLFGGIAFDILLFTGIRTRITNFNGYWSIPPWSNLLFLVMMLSPIFGLFLIRWGLAAIPTEEKKELN